MHVSVVIPCYNSGRWLAELCERISQALKKDYEIILVNDASPDNGNTWEVICKLANDRENNVKGINLQYNSGQYASLLCGIENAKGSLIVTMDDDFQHLPEDIPKMILKMEEDKEVDCLIGYSDNRNDGIIRKLGSKSIGIMYHKILGKPKGIKMGSFRILRRNLIDAMLKHRTNRPLFGPILLASTNKIENIKIQHNPRIAGNSGYTFKKLSKASFDILFDATTLPLRIFSMVGLFFSTLAMFFGFFYLYNYFNDGVAVQGWTSIVLLITFFGGTSLIGLGLIGEYIDRIVKELRGSAKWHIREILSSEDE